MTTLLLSVILVTWCSFFVTSALVDSDNKPSLQELDVTSLSKEADTVTVNQSVTTNERPGDASLTTVGGADWMKHNASGTNVSGVTIMDKSLTNNNPSIIQNSSKTVISCDVILLHLPVLSISVLL